MCATKNLRLYRTEDVLTKLFVYYVMIDGWGIGYTSNTLRVLLLNVTNKVDFDYLNIQSVSINRFLSLEWVGASMMLKNFSLWIFWRCILIYTSH